MSDRFWQSASIVTGLTPLCPLSGGGGEAHAFEAGEVDATGVASKGRLASVEDMDGIEIRTAMRPFNILITLNSESPHLGISRSVKPS